MSLLRALDTIPDNTLPEWLTKSEGTDEEPIKLTCDMTEKVLQDFNEDSVSCRCGCVSDALSCQSEIGLQPTFHDRMVCVTF